MSGVLNKVDGVAWAAMSDSMLKVGRFKRVQSSLDAARNDGKVIDSINLCRESLIAEQQARESLAVCLKLTNDEAVNAVLAMSKIGGAV